MESLHTNKPHLLIMVGIPGSGKSFFAEHFSGYFSAPIISSELIRKELFNSPNYSKDEELAISKISNYLLIEIMKTNKTIVYRANTETRQERSNIYSICKENGYIPLVIWVQTDIINSKKRITKIASGNNDMLDYFEHKLVKFNPPIVSEKAVVISGKHTFDSQLKIVLKHLANSNEVLFEPKTYVKPTDKRHFLIR